MEVASGDESVSGLTMAVNDKLGVLEGLHKRLKFWHLVVGWQ